MKSSMKHRVKRYIKIALLLPMITFIAVVSIDTMMSVTTSEQIYSNVEQLPEQDVALVLGTSKYIGRQLNAYYQYRIDAAIELFDTEKVSDFLLSGDNAHRSYNEPWTMKRDLLKAGVPEERITLDYAGFRTLDSIVRAKEVFELTSMVIVSQRFHCERALFIANHYNMNAVCLAVQSPQGYASLKLRVREMFARSKAILDLFIIGAQPKFLGPKEPIFGDQP
ncbi:SanA/YdcF family protein [Aliivibrio kagoshimensis]|uniref:SanA/YdcF family protein n=1 Tax=Aliivibrio kagoshimensis TaxID=2910230 RepID=UPI003D0A409C